MGNILKLECIFFSANPFLNKTEIHRGLRYEGNVTSLEGVFNS